MTEPSAEPRSEAWAATAEPDDELSRALDNSTDDDTLADDTPADMRTVRKLRREAAANRVRAQEAEAKLASEREANVAKLAEYERREAERAASSVLIDPQDLWVHTTPDEQRNWNDEFGAVIGDRVKEAAEAIIAARPHLARPQRPPTAQPLEGLKPGASPAPQKKQTSWASALHGRG